VSASGARWALAFEAPGQRSGLLAQHSGLLAQHSGLPDRRSALLGRRSPLLDRHSALLGRRSALLDRPSALLDRPSALLDRPLGSATGAAEGFRQRLRQIAVLLLAGQVTVAKPCHSSVWWARFRLFRHNLIVLPVLAEVIHAAFAPILPTRLGRLVLRKPQSNRGADNDSRKCRTNSPLGKG
jgi:hypothetical protein